MPHATSVWRIFAHYRGARSSGTSWQCSFLLDSEACTLYAITHIGIDIVRSNAYRMVRGFGLGIFPAGGGPGSAFGLAIFRGTQ